MQSRDGFFALDRRRTVFMGNNIVGMRRRIFRFQVISLHRDMFDQFQSAETAERRFHLQRLVGLVDREYRQFALFFIPFSRRL